MQRPSRIVRVITIFLVSILLFGGLPFLSGCQFVSNQPTAPTTNPTLLAIMVMLTQTAAAPTITLTPTPGPTPTGTVTVFVPPPGSVQKPVRMGEQINQDGLVLTVLSMTSLNEVGETKATEGRAYLDVSVILDNTTNQKVTYSPLFFKLYNAADLASKLSAGGNLGSIEIQPAGINSPKSPALLPGTLTAGERARGHLYFNIPAGENAYVLGFDPQARPGKAPVVWYDLSQPALAAPANANQPTTLTGREVPLKHLDVNTGVGLSINAISVTRQIENTKAEDGSVLLLLDVTVENVKRANVPYNPEYFKVKDLLGYEYPPMVIPLETLLQAGSLKERASVSGRVVFQVPESTRRLLVEFQPVVIGETYDEFRLLIDVPQS